ncbi:MAG: TRAP transporter substrate-binding protein DctP, partial [Geminicoccales bacterium]
RRIAEAVAGATGYLVLGAWDNGLRHISNRVRPIRHPDDCRGLWIRTLDNALHREVFRALGFEPVTIDVRHLARAVADGAVDAQENPLTNLVNFGLHHSHRHVSLTGHFLGVALVLANRERFAGWPAHVREAVLQAIAEATCAQRRLAVEEDAACLARLRADGVELVPAEAIDRAAFAAAVADITAREAAALDHELLAALDGDRS